MVIVAADRFTTNSDLMIACRDLGYINDGDDVMDVTYGKGTWWKKWSPLNLVTHDLAIDGVDFRRLPYPHSTFDVVTFDPPYVSVGGRKTSTIGDFNDAYGLVDVPRTPDELHELMYDGLMSIHRVLRPKGLVLFKAMNYVTSGKYRTQAYDVMCDLTRVSLTPPFKLIDEFIHLRGLGPQPKRDKQLHARRNYSHLFCLQAVK